MALISVGDWVVGKQSRRAYGVVGTTGPEGLVVRREDSAYIRKLHVSDVLTLQQFSASVPEDAWSVRRREYAARFRRTALEARRLSKLT